MEQQNKKRGIIQKLKDKYRLIIYNDVTFEEIFQLRLSRLNLVALIGSISIFLVVLTAIIIAFTPLKEFIPGYPEASLRKTVVQHSITIDSLKQEIELRQQYVENIHRLVSGKKPSTTSFTDKQLKDKVKKQAPSFKPSKKDSLFRAQIEEKERYNLSINGRKKETKNDISDILFFTPLNGMITNSFDVHKEHYGTDIVSGKSGVVKATLDGIVVMDSWTIETGHIIAIQHKNNLLSVYKHNAQLMQKTGEHVKAGEVIAMVGNSGELTTGPHLHFELWHNGHPINPENYIDF